MSRQTRAVVLAAVLVAVPVLAGCSALPSGSETTTTALENVTAETVKDQTIASMQDVETYRFDLDMTVTSGEVNTTITGSGAVNQTARRMYTQTNITGPFSEQSEQYIIGSTAYVNLKGMWRAVNISEQQPWNRSMALDQQRMILESSNVTLVDTETTDGQTVHVLQIEPNETVLRNLLQRQTDTSGFARMTFENATYRQYVRADTYQIERIDLQMEVRQGDQTGTLSMQMDFEDYGSGVSISLPEEATNSTTL